MNKLLAIILKILLKIIIGIIIRESLKTSVFRDFPIKNARFAARRARNCKGTFKNNRFLEVPIIYNFGYRDLNNAHLRYYALQRYIIFDNNWKRCISIIVNNWYYGNEIITLENAAKYYFNKDFKNITDRELIALLLIKPQNGMGTGDFI